MEVSEVVTTHGQVFEHGEAYFVRLEGFQHGEALKFLGWSKVAQ